ncbi:hypothetical protein Bpfe_001269, partial [Biomphalaria pfeifferi]
PMQVFLEERPIIFFCPSIKFSPLQLKLVTTYKTFDEYYWCEDIEKECINDNGYFAQFNISGYYFPFHGKDIEQKRSLKSIECIFNKTSYYKSDIAIVAKPQNITCFASQLTYYSTDMSVSCMTSKIYPEAYCIVNYSNEIPGQVSYSHAYYYDTVKYYQSNCTWTLALNYFQAGNHTLEVFVYPNVTNDTNFATSLTFSFEFTLPNISLSNECLNGTNVLNGYIRPESTIKCVCYLNSIGYPPAILKWSNSSDLDLKESQNKTATSLIIGPSSNKITYTCKASTKLLNGDVSASYKVNYAKGPTECLVQLKDTTQTIWKICKNEFINLSIICQVNQTSAIPGIKAKLSINSSYSNLLDSQNLTFLYQVKNEINITKAGNYSIGCQVQNILYEDVVVTCIYPPVLQVMAPPATPPNLQFRNNANEIQENTSYIVECTAPGGIPLVSNLTLSCGNINGSTQIGNIFTSPVTFTRNMTGQNCTCTAQHITGCYEKNTTTLQLNVLCKMSVLTYTAAIVYLNVTSSVIEKGNYAQLYCEADGNPAPKISIVKGNEIIVQNSSGYILFLNKSMSCKDGGNYICQANNGVDLNIYNKQVILFVRCPLQFSSDENFKNFTLQEGNTFFYNFTIYGYPDPDKITISKFNQGKNNVNVTRSSLETPFSFIELKIARLTHTDFDNYTLLIFQNGSQPLLFSFSISKENNLETNINIAAAVGGSIAAFVLLIIFTIAFIVFRRYEITCKKKQTEHSAKETHTYSELSISQQQLDLHNYETPIIITNLQRNESMETYSKYMNVKGQDNGVSQYEEIDNIKS